MASAHKSISRVSAIALLSVALSINQLSLIQPLHAATGTACDNYASGGSAATVSSLGSGTVDCVIKFTGSMTWTTPLDFNSSTKVLVVGGGGGGGNNVGFGGGGGASIYGTFTPTASAAYSISVGAGGAGGTNPLGVNAVDVDLKGKPGTQSSFTGSGLNVVAGGGSGGNTAWQNTVCNGATAPAATYTTGGAVTSTTGLTGVTSNSGGTGGYSVQNGNGVAGTASAVAINIDGTSYKYGGGGGSSAWGALTGGSGAAYGGGTGASSNPGVGGAGTDGSGGGGGGGNAGCSNGGRGGNGTVIIRYTPVANLAVSTNPNNQSISAGATATLSCGYTGAGTPTVQWYSSTDGSTWNTISGATSSSYTTPALPYASDGIKYKATYTVTYNGATTSATTSVATISISKVAGGASISLAGSPNSIQFNRSIVITVNLTGGDAKVSFYMNGRRIPSCYKIQSSSLVATCNFKPNIHGEIRLSVEASPTSSNYTSSTASQVVRVSERTNTR